jgi:glyoxylase-like metal-dependent hydrolase (beta-lactamase superfamily II)
MPGKMRVKTVVNGLFYENCYIVWEPGGTCIILDPGDEAHMVASMIREMELSPVLIAATHAHIDYVGAVAELRDAFRVPFAVHELEVENLERLPLEAQFMGLPSIAGPTVDRRLQDGEMLSFGDCALEVVHTPGHTAGSVCLIGDQMVFAGDTLFAGGYGRTDLHGGDEEALLRSVEERIFVLDDTTIVYAGYGPTTTIGEERRTNWICNRLRSRQPRETSSS